MSVGSELWMMNESWKVELEGSWRGVCLWWGEVDVVVVVGSGIVGRKKGGWRDVEVDLLGL